MKITFCIEKGDVIPVFTFLLFNVLPTFDGESLIRDDCDNISVTN